MGLVTDEFGFGHVADGFWGGKSKDSFEFSVVCTLLSTKSLDVLMCQLLRSVFFNRAGKLLAGRGAVPRNNFELSLWRAPH